MERCITCPAGANAINGRCMQCHDRWCRKEVRKIYDKPSTRVRIVENTYGLSADDHQKLYDSQYGECKICAVFSPKRALRIDHCHRTGRVRGLLCNRCNTGLGQFNDDAELMRRAITYLEDTCS